MHRFVARDQLNAKGRVIQSADRRPNRLHDHAQHTQHVSKLHAGWLVRRVSVVASHHHQSHSPGTHHCLHQSCLYRGTTQLRPTDNGSQSHHVSITQPSYDHHIAYKRLHDTTKASDNAQLAPPLLCECEKVSTAIDGRAQHQRSRHKGLSWNLGPIYSSYCC